MASKLYVGNLPHATKEDELSEIFSSFGTVKSVQIIMDKETGKSRGFGFVEMESDDQAQAAVAALNGQDLGGRPLTVNEARPREERSGGFRDRPRGGRRPY